MEVRRGVRKIPWTDMGWNRVGWICFCFSLLTQAWPSLSAADRYCSPLGEVNTKRPLGFESKFEEKNSDEKSP